MLHAPRVSIAHSAPVTEKSARMKRAAPDPFDELPRRVLRSGRSNGQPQQVCKKLLIGKHQPDEEKQEHGRLVNRDALPLVGAIPISSDPF